MELFAIDRYNENTTETDPGKEDEIFKKLLKKVEKRKRQLENVTKIDSFSDQNELLHTEEQGIVEEPDLKISKSDDSQKEDLQKVEETTAENAQTFQILGDDIFKKKQKVEMVLPAWLAYPTIISNKISQDKTFDKLIENLEYISPQIKDNLKSMKIDKLFPVQEKVIPWLLNAHSKPDPFRPRDICVSAQTGSGKTLAFAVPIVQLLLNRVERKIRALVVLPVNDLALQVFKVFKRLVDKTSLNVCLLSKSVPFANEQNQLVETFKGRSYSKADIVITTPGRLVEHLHATPGFCLKSLKFLILDEADRIMEQIHHNWLYHLDNHVKNTSDMMFTGRTTRLCLVEIEQIAVREPHKMLFSATLSQDPEKLQNLRLFQPMLFTSVVKSSEETVDKFISKSQINDTSTKDVRGEFIGKYTTPAELREKYCITEMRLKPLTLYSLIVENKWKKFLCFANNAEATHRLSFVLQELFRRTMNISELSSALNLNDRKNILSEFAVGKINGLICSDALARGIDIPEVDIVISYDAPRHIKTYIHRIGRTARAGRVGTAVTLLTQGELKTFENILAEADKDLVDEIKVESNIEEEKAKIYMVILKKLQSVINYEKQMKLSAKNYIKNRVEKTNVGELSVMDRLQAEVTNMIIPDDDGVTDNTKDLLRKQRKNKVKAEKRQMKKQLHKTDSTICKYQP